MPTNYTSIGVTVGSGARSPIDQQPVIASPQSSNYTMERDTDSCFALIGAHQCGILMVDGWMTGVVGRHGVISSDTL